MPTRKEEVLDGGSLYWIIRRFIRVRQRIIGLEAVVGDDGIPRCDLILDPELIRTEPQPRRPHQGWRYLNPADAPKDLDISSHDQETVRRNGDRFRRNRLDLTDGCDLLHQRLTNPRCLDPLFSHSIRHQMGTKSLNIRAPE